MHLTGSGRGPEGVETDEVDDPIDLDEVGEGHAGEPGGEAGSDGRAGRRAEDPNLDDGYDWPGYVAKVEAAARSAAG